ncbi:MAG: helix-turn-helix transcriptional regulator [Bacilli bacterium]|nr:helix-turn-helix transcriptional regulator [Bacillales bacterium]MDY2575631.1 helix-turn-helix transcriptional regulator [Bacilli bacterium]
MIISISERIKELREKQNITQSSLAKKLNITRSAVNAWEMGISIPNVEKLVELSSLFNVSVDYLLGVNSSFTINISNLSEEEKKLVLNLVNILSEK